MKLKCLLLGHDLKPVFNSYTCTRCPHTQTSIYIWGTGKVRPAEGGGITRMPDAKMTELGKKIRERYEETDGAQDQPG